MSTNPNSQNAFNLNILLVLSFGHLATDMCQGALPTILPFLKAKLSLTYAMAGVIMLASNLTSSVIQPLFGYLSDRKEKGFLLPLGCLFAGLGLCLLSLPDRYEVVLLLVIISGLGIASFHPEGFKTARFFTGDKLATGLSVFTVGGNIGFALGPISAVLIITHLGLDYLPAIVIFSLFFLALLFLNWSTIASARFEPITKKAARADSVKGAHLSVALTIAAVVMRSWTHFGIMTYIPFYYIDYLKGDPVYAGTLVSIFLLGGAVGTLLGAPIADRWGHKRYFSLSLALASALFPLIFVAKGPMLFVVMGAVGMVMISSFTVTIVMCQELMPGNLGMASGLMAGFAIGTGGIGVTILGVIADHFGVPFAVKSIMALPLAGLLISLFIRYPLRRRW